LEMKAVSAIQDKALHMNNRIQIYAREQRKVFLEFQEKVERELDVLRESLYMLHQDPEQISVTDYEERERKLELFEGDPDVFALDEEIELRSPFQAEATQGNSKEVELFEDKEHHHHHHDESPQRTTA